jgi:hypothetical protein
MTRTVARHPGKSVAYFSALLPSKPTRNVLEVLSEALGPTWTVHRETDCNGEISIIVLPAADDAEPVFVLYEKDGLAHVATVCEDAWEGDRGFFSFQDAVAGIIAEAMHPSRQARHVI